VGVELDDGRRIDADAVVSNADVRRTHRDLLGDSASIAAARRISRRWAPACSGIVLYLGLKRRYDHLRHHNFMFSADGRREFDEIYGRGEPASDPTLYVCAPSRSDETQAPPGCEALYVLVHTAPLGSGSRWHGAGGLLERERPRVLAKLRRHGLEDIERQIEVERILTPEEIEALYGSEHGSIYGLASHGRLRGGFKPSNRSPLVRGLYFCGGSVNPGPGVPMVLMSGVTAANAIAEDLGIAAPGVAECAASEAGSSREQAARADAAAVGA